MLHICPDIIKLLHIGSGLFVRRIGFPFLFQKSGIFLTQRFDGGQLCNPNLVKVFLRRLLPGMFARLQANAGTRKNAVLIPQRAVKEMLYKKFVFVIGNDNQVDMREVTLGARVGKLWLVEKGLNGDETIVVEGIQKVNKGSEVKATAMTEAELSTESNSAANSAAASGK